MINIYLFIFIKKAFLSNLIFKSKNIPKLQDEFLEKLKKLVSSAKFKIESRNENQITIRIKSSKAAAESDVKNK